MNKLYSQLAALAQQYGAQRLVLFSPHPKVIKVYKIA